MSKTNPIYKYNRNFPIIFQYNCGPDENRTHHTNLARIHRQPWNMPAHLLCRSYRIRTHTNGFGDRHATITPNSCAVGGSRTHIPIKGQFLGLMRLNHCATTTYIVEPRGVEPLPHDFQSCAR